MNTHPKQQGFILVSIVMVVTVLMVLIATYMVNLQHAQQVNTRLSERRVQAWFSAYSGMQWAVNNALHHNANHLNCGQVAPTFTLTGGGTDGLTVTVNCTTAQATEGENRYTVYALEVTAFQGTIDSGTYVTQTIQKTVRTLNPN